MSKVKAKRITIERAEGPVALCGTKVFEGADCWDAARSWLLSQSDTFPKDRGYDKHDFKVDFEDGEEYEGRLDCKHRSCEDADLDVAAHVRDFVQFFAGVACPAHMTPAEYERNLDMLHRRGETTRGEYEQFLLTYDLGA